MAAALLAARAEAEAQGLGLRERVAQVEALAERVAAATIQSPPERERRARGQ
jgi:hypothetical protein